LCTVQTKEHDNLQVRINLSQITTSKEDNKPRKKKGNYQQNGQGIIANKKERKTQGKNKKQTESKKDHSILSR
jgi:hypothetical protein